MNFFSRLLLMASALAFIASLCFLATRVSPVLLVMAFLVACVVAKRRSMQLSAHGTAAWADDSDLRRAGMLDGDSGLILGRMECERPRFRTGLKALFNIRLRSRTACHVFLRSLGFWRGETHLVRLRNAVHTTVFAPTGAGKGVSIVIPTLLTCKSSMVVVDIKGELFRTTAEHRRRMGFRVVVLDPFRIATHTPDTLNVLDYLDASDPDLIDRCRDIAEAMVVRSPHEKEPHWSDSAVIWISAIILVVVLFGEPGERSLQTVRRLLTDPAQMEAAVKLLCSSDACDGIASRLGSQLSQFKDKELSSVLTTVSRHMRFLDTPAVAASTRTSTFDPADIKGEKVTVFLCLSPDHVRAQSGLLRLWVETLSRAVVKGGVRKAEEVIFLLDEAAALGQMDAIDNALNVGRGYGLRLILIYQSMAQLKKCFPDGQDGNIQANTTAIYFAVNDPVTAEEVSKRLGDFTEVVTSGGTSTGGSTQRQEDRANGSFTQSHGANHNWSQVARRLLKPEEVCALHPQVAITFTQNVPPVCTWLLKWYEEPHLAQPPGWCSRLMTAAKTLALSVLFASLSAMLVFAVIDAQMKRGTLPRYSWSPR